MYTLKVDIDHSKILKPIIRTITARFKLMHESQKACHSPLEVVRQFKTIRYNIGRQTGLSTFVADCLNRGFPSVNTSDVSYTKNNRPITACWCMSQSRVDATLRLSPDTRTGAIFDESTKLEDDYIANNVEILFVDLETCRQMGGVLDERRFWKWMSENQLVNLKAVIII